MNETNIARMGSTCCELGEGPHYNGATNTAWWFDIVGKKLVEHQLDDGRTTVHDLPRMASFVADVNQGVQLLAMEDGLYLRSISTGSLQLVTTLEADKPNTRSNDGRTHPSGRLWIGTMGKKAERQAGAIYLFDGATVHPLFRDITIPNSICFSPDGRTGYFADTALNTVFRVPLDPATAQPLGEPEVFLTGKDLPLGGHFDGSVTDAHGVMWNASWGGGSVSGFAPQDGAVVATYEVPAAKASCPCFVGSDLGQIMVTTAWEGYGPEGRKSDPGAGYSYLIKGGFAGRAAVPVLVDAAHTLKN